jgi:ABC-2 type transport system permease protein
MKMFLKLFTAQAKELLRDRMSLFWYIAFPVIFILIFGAIFSDINDYNFDVGIVTESEGPVAQGITHAFESIESFTISKGSREEELEALRAGDRSVVLVLPPAMEQLFAGQQVQVEVHYDKGQEQTTSIVLSIVDQVLEGIEQHLTGKTRLLVADRKPVTAEHLRNIDFILPGILAMAIMQLGLFGSFNIVSLREKKVLKSMGATPLPRLLLLGSEILVRVLLSLFQTLLIIIIGRIVFDVHVTGPWYQVIPTVLLGSVTFISLGYMLTSFAKSEESGIGLVQLVQFPMMFFAGIFFPTELMPDFLQPLVKVIPLTYLGDLLRHVMVSMPASYPVVTSLLVLGGVAIGSVVGAALLWRWE